MSNYTKSTNFATKDNLSPGNPLKIVKGTEIDTEFNNIQTAVATKTDNASANITGGSITGITDLAVADGGTGASTAAGGLNNLLPSQTGNANKYLQTDGTNASWDAVSLSTSDITGTLPVANGGTGVTTSTGTGNVVLSNSPTLVTPTLGTPASGTATNLTGLPISTGVSGLGTGVATFLGTPSSANLASAVTDETGSGALVFATSPTLVTPVLGTPASGTLTNATGLPISTGVSGLGIGVATFLGTPSSANLLAAVSDETGTGSLVFANSPTLVTPALGTPSALVGTNITGTASGLTAGNVTTNANLTGAITSSGNATSLGSFSSANLLAALTDETGTGANVFATSPTLVTPILGTPTSATLTNATGLPLSTGVTGTLPVANGGTGTTTPSIVAGSNITVTGTWPNQTIAASAGGSGTVTSVAATVPSVFSVSGSPITTSGTLAMTYSGTALPVANGGTGQTSYTDGQLLIGNSTGNTLTKATLTAGTNVTITNAAGAITIAASGGGGSAATPTALGTVYGKTNTGSATAIGYEALASTTTAENVGVGYRALYANTSGANNTAMGHQSSLNSVGSNNSSFGYQTLANNQANNCTAVGYQTLINNSTGASNTAVGYAALDANTTGTENSAVGFNALGATTTGQYDVAVGAYALALNTTGSNNVGVGYGALVGNTTASNNTATGHYALQANTTGANNTAVGSQAAYTNSTGTYVAAFGYKALYLNTTGNYNAAFGGEALASNTTGANNAAVGVAALNANTTGGFNVGIGRDALASNTTGNSHTAVGYGALYSNTTATGSTAIGYRAGYSCTAGDNLFIGYEAGQYITATTSGSSNAIVGAYSRGSGATVNFEFVFGYNLAAKGTQTFFVGGTSGAYNSANSATWSVTSDQRLKKNIVDNNVGLDAINSIRVRNFEYRVADEVTELPTHCAVEKTGVQLGVIAQELQAVLPECVKTESTGVMSVDADNLTWYLINAVKELSARVKQLEGN